MAAHFFTHTTPSGAEAQIGLHFVSSRKVKIKLEYKNFEFKLTVPDGAPPDQIKSFMKSCDPFIEKNVLKNENLIDLSAASNIHEDILNLKLSLPILGQPWIVKHRENAMESGTMALDNGTAWLNCNMNKDLRLQLLAAIKKLCEESSITLANTYCAQLSIPPPKKISAKILKGKWGCCRSTREIELDWRSIFLPVELYAYLIAHEVSHLVEMNHSSAFWKTVGSIRPRYQREDVQLNGWISRTPKI